MARVLRGSQFYLHTPRTSANGMKHTCFCFPSRSWYSFTDPRDGRLSWLWVANWFHTEIYVRHRELNPDTVTHLSTKRARRRLTSLIEDNTLTTTTDHQLTEAVANTACVMDAAVIIIINQVLSSLTFMLSVLHNFCI